MSGVFGPVAQIQVPDFAATQMRAQELAMRRQAMQERDALSGFFRQNAQGFASPDAAKRMNLLAMLAQQGGQGAAMALPQMQALREEMEWSGAGQAAPQAAPQGAPMAMPAVAAPAGEGGGFSPAGLAINTRSESGGDPNARPLFPDGTPRSSATGPNQFIDGTWMAFARANPQLFQGMTPQQILDARRNPALSAQATQWYAQQNAPRLRAAGVPVNDATLGLAHQFDGPVAARIVTAPPNTPIADIVGPAAMRANPDLAGKTAGEVVQIFQRRYAGSGGDTIPAQAAAPGAPPRDAGGLPPVPGFDLDRVRRAISLPNNAAAQRYLQTYMQAAQVMRREAEPLEIVEGPNGPIMVPRSQAVGMRPGSRETAPLSEERFRQQQALAEAGAARSTTTVNAGDRRTDVLIADAWKASEDTAVAAGRRAALFNRAEQAMQTFQPGMLAERRIWLGQLARELGVRSPSTAEGEVLRQVQRQLELATTPQGQGAITENERGLIRDAIPVLLTTPEGARQAIAMIRRLDDYEMQIARIYRENARRNGGQPNAVSVREEIAAFIAQNQPPDVQALLENLSGPAPSAPGGVQADSPPSVPPPPRGFRIVQ